MYSTSSRLSFSSTQYARPNASRAARPAIATASTNERGKLPAPIEAHCGDLLRHEADQKDHDGQGDEQHGGIRDVALGSDGPDAVPGADQERAARDWQEHAQRAEDRHDP